MRRMTVVLAVLMVVGLWGCGGGEKQVVKQQSIGTGLENAPAWVQKESGAFSADKGMVVYGVGIADGTMVNVALKRDTAQQRARVAVGRVIKSTVTGLFKDYMDDHKDFLDMDTAGEDQLIQEASKVLTDATLVNCQIVDHFENPVTGDLYALARYSLDDSFFDAYKNNLKKELRTEHMRVVKDRADEMMNSLDTDLAKQRAREDQIVGSQGPATQMQAPATGSNSNAAGNP